jgi:hypothetical protein
MGGGAGFMSACTHIRVRSFDKRLVANSDYMYMCILCRFDYKSAKMMIYRYILCRV